MTNQVTKEYLNYFTNSQNPNFAVMLKGKWGSGKTYFIRELIEEWNNQEVMSQKGEVNLKPIYVSLNGVSKKSEIIEALKAKISPFLYSKGVKIATEIFKGFIKSTLKIDFDYDEDNKVDGSANINFDPISIFKSTNDKIKGNRIIIFDDVERCKIALDELYGFINDFVEHSQCKIILIADEEKIDKKHNEDSKFKYSVFKEKIIGQTFEIKPETEKAINFFLDSATSEIKSYLIDSKDLIIKIFEISQKENLRVLQRAIYDFERLLKFTNTELSSEEEKYNKLIKNYLGYFLIYFLEFKTGNEDISSFQEIQFFSNDKSENKYTQYEEIITTFSLFHSSQLFTPLNLIDFIKNGNYLGLVNEINNSEIYVSKNVAKDWETLWHWQVLNDDDFISTLKNVSTCFFKSNNFQITEVLHISGILFTLIDEKLYKSKNKLQIVKRAKQLIKKMNLADFKDRDGAFSILSYASWQKQYMSREADEFKSIVNFTKNILENIKQVKSAKVIEDIFYGITNENIDEIYLKTRDYNESLENTIERTPMLSNLSPQKFAKTIFNLENNTINRLIWFFEKRYFPEKTYSNLVIEDHQRQEKDFLIHLHSIISSEIQSGKNRKKLIRQRTLKSFNEMIEQCIAKL
jgi:hypothetical protein